MLLTFKRTFQERTETGGEITEIKTVLPIPGKNPTVFRLKE